MGVRTRCLVVSAVVAVGTLPGAAQAQPGVGTAAIADLALTVTTEISGLNRPWDAVLAPDGTILTGEKTGRFVVKLADGTTRALSGGVPNLWVSSEAGLMGLAVSRDFAADRTVYACHGHSDAGATEIRVTALTVDAGWTTLTPAATVVEGIDTASGRHAGCKILAHPDGTLYISTGDAAVGTNPQDRASLAGKVLHVTTAGAPAPGNPDPASPVHTLGHRNPQGLALHPVSGQLYNIEHGTSRDDEVNLLVPGGNYGWRPDTTSYSEEAPMTDTRRVPGALTAAWSSGFPTIATAGGAFTQGAAWGPWQHTLAVATLKAQRLVLMRFSSNGRTVTSTGVPSELSGTFGRLRSVTSAPDGTLLITTDSGTNGRVLRVTPSIPRQRPGIRGTLPGRAALDAPYSGQLTITGSPTPALAVTRGALPPGLTLAQTGSVTGTPTSTGNYRFTVTASSDGFRSASKSFTIRVR